MAEPGKKNFISEETERHIQEFEQKLKAKQAAMPDTSIRSGAGGINVLENYHFHDDNIPIYDSGINKQIDRVDMEVDRLRRTRRTALQDEVDEVMRRVHEERMAEENAQGLELDKGHKTEPFVFAVPVAIILIAVLFMLLSSAAG